MKDMLWDEFIDEEEIIDAAGVLRILWNRFKHRRGNTERG